MGFTFLSFFPLCKLVLDQIEGFFNTEHSSSSGGFSATKNKNEKQQQTQAVFLATIPILRYHNQIHTKKNLKKKQQLTPNTDPKK
jgi:hypothetical protein